MNNCNCENQNCKHNLYIQPPKGTPQPKYVRYVRSDVPMQYESEQKLSYKNYFIQNDTPDINSSVRTNCFGDLKYGFYSPFETTHHSSYKEWKTPNKLVIKKPKDCVNLLGSGPLNLNTTQQTEFQRKMISKKTQSKKFMR